MSDNHRIKLLLVRRIVSLDDKELIKTDESKYQVKSLNDEDDTQLYYRFSGGFTPRWYRKYLEQDDKDLVVRYASGLLFRKINYNEEEYKFAVTFGGADSMLNMEYFEPRFGLKVALNLADKIFSVSKSSISTTMARMKETAVQDQELSDFVFDMQEDLLKGVVVKPKHNQLSTSNISGNIGLSITTEISFKNLNQLLERSLDEYYKDSYKQNYGFLDNMIEINDKSDLIDIIYEIIFKAFKDKDISKMWFAPLDEVEWESVESYSFYKNRISKDRIGSLEHVNSIDFDNIYDFISEDLSSISNLKDLKKYKIIINSTDGRYDDRKWNFLDCMYASVEFNNNHYVLNEGHLYEINKKFYTDYQNEYENLYIFSPLGNGIKNQTEREYLESVCDSNPDLLLVDQKLVYTGRGKFEPCDIFDIPNRNFIHVKRYGSSKILSHLFAQATVSSDLFMNKRFNADVLDKIKNIASESGIEVSDFEYSKCQVTMAIITEKDFPQNGRVNIPFFSMVNVVRTIQQINDWGYKQAGIMFIKAE
ncbi:MAG: DUF6119 family protein [Candidatus Izemoplasmatales bacterium]